MSDKRKNLLPGVPLVESPFFADFFDPKETDPRVYEAAVQLNRNGYAILDSVDEDFDAVADRIKTNLHDRYDWDGWREGRTSLRIQDAWRFDDDVRRLATSEKIIELLSALYGRRAWPFQTLNFPVGTQQHHHTDSVHFSSMPERFMCGVWTALEDIGLDQGPLVYYPGSHKWPIYTNEHIGHRHADWLSTMQTVYEDMWDRMIEVTGIEPVRLSLKKGQSLIWSANLLHGGDLHIDRSKTRWSQVTHFYFEDCAYYTPMKSDLPAGLIDFRKPLNILTGQTEENHFLGRMIDKRFIEVTSLQHLLDDPASQINPPPFDSEAYLQANPDVAAAGEDAYSHWVKHGIVEGRPLKL